MKKGIYLLCSLLFIISLLIGCQSKQDSLKDNKLMNINNVIKFKDSYVGDNSAVMNILWNLPGGEFVKRISLDTKKPPYGINVEYGLKDNTNLKEENLNEYWNKESTEKIVLNNATTLFILIKNVDTITFKLDTINPQSYIIHRKDLENFYGKDLRSYGENTSLWEKEVLENNLNSNQRIDEFFKI